MPIQMTIFEELLIAARTQPPLFELQRSDEDDQAFLLRLCRHISAWPSSRWNSTSPRAATWYNHAAQNLKDGFMISPPEGFKPKGRQSDAASIAQLRTRN